MTAPLTRSLTADERLWIESGDIGWHEMFPRALDPQDIHWMLCAHQAGASVPYIARYFRVSQHAVRHVIVCNTPQPPPPDYEEPVGEHFGRGPSPRPLLKAILILTVLLCGMALVIRWIP